METKIIYRKPLGNPDRTYRQDKFIISSCKAWGAGFVDSADDIRRCIQICKEVGCDMTEYIWASPELTRECIMACEEYGIDGVFVSWDAFGSFERRKRDNKINFEKLEDFMNFAKKYKHFYGYNVWDEPLPPENIAATREQLDIIEGMDPGKLYYTVAIPSYNTDYTWENGLFEDYMERYTKEINPAIMALDYYPFAAHRSDSFEQLDNHDIFLDIAVTRRLGLEIDAPLWFCIQVHDSPFMERYYRFTPEKMNMQANNVLMHGGKAIQLYATVEGAVYNDGRKGPMYFPIRDMNKRLHQWGKTVMALTSEHVFHSPELLRDNKDFEKYREPLTDSKILADKELPFRCSAGELTDAEGNRYMIIMNRDYNAPRKFNLNLQKDFRVYQISDFDGTQSVKHNKTKKLSLELAPGAAVFLRFQDAKEKAYLIDYVLEA